MIRWKKQSTRVRRGFDEGSYQAALALIKVAGLEGIASEIGPDDAEKIIKKKKHDEEWAKIYGV